MKKLILLFLLPALLSCEALALSWEEAVSLSERNSHELRSAQKDLEASEWTYRRSFSVFLPQLSLSAGLSSSQSGGNTWSQSYSYGLSASQQIFRGMEGIYGIQSAYAGLEQQKASLLSTRASVLYSLRSAFLDVYYSQENVRLLEEILKQRRQNTGLIQLRYDSGKEDKGNLMTTQADEKSAEHDLASAQRDLELARLKLAQLLRVEVKEVEEKVELAAPDKTDFEALLKETPAYLIAKKQLEAAELSYKASISGFLPSLSLSGSYRRSGSDWPPDTASKSLSLSLSYSLFDGGSSWIDRVVQDVQLAAAREDFENSVKDLRYDLQKSHDDLLDALEALQVAEVSLAAGRERAKITEIKYLNGLTGYDEWYRIDNTYISARKSLLNYKRSALLAEAAWHESYGGYVK